MIDPEELEAADALTRLGFTVVRLSPKEQAANDAAWRAYGSPGSCPHCQAAAKARYRATYDAAMAELGSCSSSELHCERAECGNVLSFDDTDGVCSYCAERDDI